MLGRKADIRVGGDFSTVPADKYTVQIADVNFKTRFNKWKQKDEEMLNFQYVILNDNPLTDENGKEDGTTRGKYLWHLVSQSLSTRSWLMKLAKAVYGRDLTKEELDPTSPKFFNPEDLIGKQVDVMVSEDPNKDNTAMFNNVAVYSKTVKPLESWEVTSTGQAVIESESKPITEGVSAPDLNPELDKFLEESAKEDSSGDTEAEDAEAEAKALEEQLRVAKEKAKKAKEAKA